MNEYALPPLPSMVPEGTPLAHAVREYARQAAYAERTAETVPVEEYRRLVARCIELGEKIATPPAAIPAAPSDAMKQWAWHWFGPDADEQWIANALANLPRGALTQPTTVQQAEQAYALKWCAAALQAVVASRGERGSIRMFVSGEKKSLEEVLDMADAALKTAQSTALPGGNGEAA